jgi:hypothetical protein
MLKEINEVRTNPNLYADKIKSNMKRVTSLNDDPNCTRQFFRINENIKINLNKGVNAFRECIDYLDNKCKPLKPLEFLDELIFPFPIEKPELASEKEYLTNTFLRISNELKEKNLKIQGFHYDNNINDAEVSTLLQIVDDNNSNGQRRRHILDKNAKYVGINIGKIKSNLYCIYLMFAS